MFLLISAFFLFALLAALHRSGKAAGVASVCLVAAVLIIVFLTPVRWPSWLPPILDRTGYHRYEGGTTTTEPGGTGGMETTPTTTPTTTATTEGVGL